MSFDGLTPVAEVSAGGWIAPRLCGFGGRVCCVAPAGFARYTRVLHPAAGVHDEPASWARVCELTGRVAHPLMQWHAIGAGWPGRQPQVGNMPPAVLAGVLDVLAGHTPDPGDCYLALWDGWGWLGDSDGVAGPRLSHPHRDYLLFHGPLDAALTIGHQVTADWRLPQSPNLLWPAGRSWLLATEIDFDSTLVGGSIQLAAELLRATGIEAWPVDVNDDLTINGDHINHVGGHDDNRG